MNITATEKQLKDACVQWLNSVPGVVCWVQNTGGLHWQDNHGRKRYQRIGEPGQSDISGMCRGIRIEIEVKKPGKRPTDDQIRWMDMINAHGGISFWVDSLGMCCDALRHRFQVYGWAWSRDWEIR